jgi:multidrug resistance efflux pump
MCYRDAARFDLRALARRFETRSIPQEIKGHVDSLTSAINVPNAQPNAAGVADVNPVFTWVRLAQRVPVRIHLDVVPEGVRLVQGMTATVQVHPKSTSRAPKG